MTFPTDFKYFSNLDCENGLPWKPLIDRLELAMGDFSLRKPGAVDQPVRTMLEISEHNGFFGMMPCYSARENAISVKLVCLMPENGKYNKPTHIVYIALFNAQTGVLEAIMEGESVTKKRTAAASALSARWMYPKNRNPKVLSVLGAGHQALSHIQILTKCYESLEVIKIWNHRQSTAEKLAEHVAGWLDNKDIRIASSVNDCVKDADLIVTATFSPNPVLMRKDLSNADVAHIMAVGAARPTMSEIDPEIWRSSKVIVDSKDGALKESGDIINSNCSLHAELGEVINKSDQFLNRNVTIYKSLGLAIQDLVAAKMVAESTDAKKSIPIPVSTFQQFKDGKSSDMKDVTIKSSVRASVSSQSQDIKLNVTSTCINDEFIVCNLETICIGNGKTVSDFDFVYKAKTGELLTVIDPRIGNQDIKEKIKFISSSLKA